jgi:hypothetical protein
METFFRWFGMPFRLTLAVASCPFLIMFGCLSPDEATDYFKELFSWAWKP